MNPAVLIVIVVGALLALVHLRLFFFSFVSTWLRAWTSGAHVPMWDRPFFAMKTQKG